MRGLFLLGIASALLLLTAAGPRKEPRWWKGNTHTHTLWSDGDAAPEAVAAEYKRRGYHFLVLSDHNIVQSGEKWVKFGDKRGQVRPEAVPPDAALRDVDGAREMRLRTLEELRARFEGPDFLFIPGEEITDTIGPSKAPLHHNSMNHTHLFQPSGGATMREAMERTVAMVEAVAQKEGRPMLVHLNHPNFHWAVTADDLAHVKGERFFEVYNGHRGVRNYGDATRPGTEGIWDYVNTLRLTKLGGDVLYGLATDDAHNYHKEGATANPGRGWIWVRSESLSPEAIIDAMNRGDFYASSGVKLEDVDRRPRALSVRVAAEPGVSYVIKFIGTRKGSDVIGEVLKRVEGTSASYELAEKDLYARAVIVSSRRHPNGYDADDFECAWTQPVK